MIGLVLATLVAVQRPDAARLADSAQRMIHRAHMAGSAEGLQQARALLERGLTAYADDAMLNHYKGYALYIEATLVQNRDGGDPLPLLVEAQRALELSARRQRVPETHALLSTVLGQQIRDEQSAMALGMQAGSELGRARQMGPENPRVWMIDGVSAMFTPPQYGGGVEQAEQKLRRAVALFAQESPPPPPSPSWGRAEAHAWLGFLLARSNRVAEARTEFQRALEIEPGYVWVRESLLPGLDRPRTGGQ